MLSICISLMLVTLIIFPMPLLIVGVGVPSLEKSNWSSGFLKSSQMTPGCGQA